MYDRGDSFPFNFEPNGIPFGSKSKENCRHNYISFNMKGNIVFSVYVCVPRDLVCSDCISDSDTCPNCRAPRMINDTLKQVIGTLVNGYISTGILKCIGLTSNTVTNTLKYIPSKSLK